MIGRKLSHYRIEERIGAGGMGVVYRAHDEQLDRDVAIKVLPSRSLTDESARKRFRKEALSLARLNHPNIATVHEFGTEGETDFLVTEFIPGVTLDSKLARGPLPPDETLRLGMQLAAGLAAAHAEGVVHRDLKPGNLRLTKDGRLKILDFGLAQLAPHPAQDAAAETISQSHDTSGTLPYMAPEQLSGETADPRTDIWAAGAVLYETATGRRPFVQPTAPLVVNAILNQSPETPSKVNPAVPVFLDAVILKALARDRAQRYQSAAELGAALQQPTQQATAAKRSMSYRWILGFAGAILICLTLAGSYRLLHRKSAQSSPTPTLSRRKSVAVLGFKNLSSNPDKSWLSTALAEMMSTEISQGDQLRSIPGESVALMKASLSLPDSESYSQQTLNKIRQNLGADEVVLGSYLPLANGALRLDLRLQDTVQGVTVASVSEKGSESEIDDLVGRAGSELRAKLGVAALSDAQTALVRATLPSNPEAARLYSEGLQKLRIFDALSARDLLEKAVKLDANHAPTHSALAEAWRMLGYDAKAKDEAHKALALASKCSREEQLLIEGRAHELLDETPQAIESYQALWQFFPDNLDYGLVLLRAQLAGGQTTNAQATLQQIRNLNSSGADAARVELATAHVSETVSDFKSTQAEADRAAAAGRSVGASLIVADALALEADAVERMGQSQKTLELVDQCRALYLAAGDRAGAARASLIAGDLLSDEGNYEAAKQKYEEAVPVFQAIGAKKGVRSTLERIGNVYYAEGKMQEAKRYYEQTLAYDHEINSTYGLASDYGNIANILDGTGDLKGALKMQMDSVASFTQVGDRRGASATLNNLGNLYVEIGDLDQAEKYYDQALAMIREISFRRGEPYPIAGKGDVSLARGDLVTARKSYEQAQAMCKEINDNEYAAQINVALATVALFEKRFADGEALAKDAVASNEKANSPGSAAWAASVLARNLLADGKLADAQTAAAKAEQMARQTTLSTPHYEVALAQSRVTARSGKPAQAIESLQKVVTSTQKFGYGLYELQARLAIAEIEQQSGSQSAKTHLAAVEKDARARGALLVANQADALLNKQAGAK